MDGSLSSILDINPFTLAFKSPAVEGDFLGEVANRRWPVLVFIFFFDLCCFLFRMLAKLTSCGSESGARPLDVVQEMGHQLANMALLYVLIGLLNKRARKAGNNAARQEEVLLSICMGLAICNLLASLRQDNAMDYVYVSFFLICTSTFLKIRWWVGTGLLAAPTVAVMVWTSSPAWSALLPPDALVHIVVAWAVGGLMAYLSDWYRRQMYANARLACAAHEKEMMEATARIQAQRELAAAQAQAAQRALTVAREKAAHEAKSEFMSLMCHEVRTPLNGCLASAEMLLETPLKEEQRELANTIRVSGSILLSTVSNFLDFFKLEAGKRLDIVRSEVELADLVGDVQRIIEAMITRGGDVRLQPPQLMGVPRAVFCDPDRLRGILLNLYTNAAKFTKAGHIVLRVSCVPPGETPAAPPGYSSIMLQPSYHPSGNRTQTDQGPAVVLNPPAALVQSAGTSKAVPRSNAQAAAGPDAPAERQQQQSPGPDAGDDAQQEPAGQEPFWHQASRWAHSLLPSQLEGSSSSMQQEDAEQQQQLATEQAAIPKKEGQSAGSSSSSLRGAQFEVHATTSAEGAAADDAASRSHSAAAAAARHQHQRQQQVAAAAPATGAALSSISSDGGRQSQGLSEDVCWLLFEVEDTGVGITTDGLATLFKEYVQGTDDEMTRPRTRGGTGLGLSICSKQVGVLGGEIGAHSCRGHGSTFWFKIPTYVRPGSRAQGAAPAAGAAKQQQQQSLPDSSSQAAAEQAAQVAGGGAEPASQPDKQQLPLRPPPVPQQQQQQQQLAVSNVVASSFYQPSSTAASGAGRPPTGSRAGAASAGDTSTQTAAADGAGIPAAAAAGSDARTAASPAAAAAPAAGSSSGTGPAAPAGAAAGGGPAAVLHSRQLSLDGPRPGPALDASRLLGRRVLLAEDNLINQTVARKMLSSLGMKVQVAANGLEALTAVRASGQGDDAFAIVLMDMAMPVMGGVEATRAIRAGGFTLPIVAMTANASDKDRDECAAAGMNGFLSKPVLRDQLARAMLAAVEEYEGPAATPAAESTATATAAAAL